MTYKIGIICITTEGSTICEKRISFLGGAKGDYPAYSVEAIPVKETFPVLFSKNWQQLANLILEKFLYRENLYLRGVKEKSNFKKRWHQLKGQ